MKKLLFAAVMLFGIVATVSAQSIVGKWKLVETRAGNTQQAGARPGGSMDQTKEITSTEFVTQMVRGDQTMTTKGKVEIKDGKYIETITEGGMGRGGESAVGRKTEYTYTVSGDKLTLKSSFGDREFEQIWERVK